MVINFLLAARFTIGPKLTRVAAAEKPIPSLDVRMRALPLVYGVLYVIVVGEVGSAVFTLIVSANVH